MAVSKWFDEVGKIVKRVERVAEGDEDDRALAEICFHATVDHIDTLLRRVGRKAEPQRAWREKLIAKCAALALMIHKALRDLEGPAPQAKPTNAKPKARPVTKVRPKPKAKAKTTPKTKAKVKTKTGPKTKAR